jgi:ABC-type siderophore export system fused ATPase/permease subunit
MDAAGRRAVYQVFQKLKTDGKTIIVISHDDTFLRIADFRIDLGAKPIPVIQARKHDDSAEGEPRLAETSEDN